jgi:hypothetical protein
LFGPKLLINAELYGLVLTPRLLKTKDTMEFGKATLSPLGPMFQHLLNNLGPNNKPKLLKVGPKFFQP